MSRSITASTATVYLENCFRFGFLLVKSQFLLDCASISFDRTTQFQATAALNELRLAALRCAPPPEGARLLNEIDQLRDAWLSYRESDGPEEKFLDEWQSIERSPSETAEWELCATLTTAFKFVTRELRRVFREHFEGSSIPTKLECLGELLAAGCFPAGVPRRLIERVPQVPLDPERVTVLQSLAAMLNQPPRQRFRCGRQNDLELVPGEQWLDEWHAVWDACHMGPAPDLPVPTKWTTVSAREYVDRLCDAVVARLRRESECADGRTEDPDAIGTALNPNDLPQPLNPTGHTTEARLPEPDAAVHTPIYQPPAAVRPTPPSTQTGPACPPPRLITASGPTTATPSDRWTGQIIWHGGWWYSRGSSDAVEVTESHHETLWVFRLQEHFATNKALQKARHHSRPEQLLKQIQEQYDGRFATAIHLPGNKSGGGYRVDIEPLVGVEQAPCSP